MKRDCIVIAKSADGKKAICVDTKNKDLILNYVNRSPRHLKKWKHIVRLILEGHRNSNLYDKEDISEKCKDVTAMKLLKGQENDRIYCKEQNQGGLLAIVMVELYEKKKTKELSKREIPIIIKLRVMNTESNKIIINPEFQDLFSFKNEKEEVEHKAQMISYRILSEIEKLCEDRKIKKKDLAELVGTSKSYITQLFNGTKSINTFIMAKFEKALDVSFEIRLKLNHETYNTFLSKQISEEYFNRKRLVGTEGAWFFCPYDKKTEDLMNKLETDNIQKQIA